MNESPTLKAIHICNSHQPKIEKEYVFANADKQTEKIKPVAYIVYKK